MGEAPFLELPADRSGDAPQVANVDGDYSYLSRGYYRSLDAELRGLRVLPTTAEALDAYVVPIAMEKARLHELPVPDFRIATNRFPEPPLMAYPVNPFSTKGVLLTDAGAVEAHRKGLTYTGKYAAICQALPEDYRIDVVRCVLGRTAVPEYRAFADAVFRAFRLPLARVRVIVTPKAYLLSAIMPLPLAQLTAEETTVLEETGTWRD